MSLIMKIPYVNQRIRS